MRVVDGSQGEGGGQVLRTAVSLATLTGEPTRVENIRANRSNPGLRPQHQTAVRACAKICRAETDGIEVGSETIVFEPRTRPQAGDWAFSVGTAGSVTLVLQTLIPPLLRADAPSELTVEGGTHTLKAPTWEYFERTYLPALERTGATLDAEIERYGFYPKGGGCIRVEIEPPAEDFVPIELRERGELRRVEATSLLLGLPDHIATRELETFVAETGYPGIETRTDIVDQPGTTGNVLYAEIASEALTEVFSEMGKKGRPAETVATRLAERVRRYLQSDAPVGPHLADQLVLPISMAGGVYRTTEMTSHCRTQLELVPKFLDVDLRTTQNSDTSWLIQTR